MITNYGANANIGKNPFVGVATGANGTIEDIRKQNFPTSTTSTQQAAAPTASPALAAMQQTGSTGGAPTQLGTRAVPAGMATGATPGSTPGSTPANDMPTVDPAKVDTSAADKLYGQQMENYQKGWDTQQKQNEMNWSRMQMGNASNAARSGMSIGGGSYLAGQRQAGIAATNANNQATLDWLKGQAGITGDAATRAANAATTNTNNVQQSNVLNTGHTWDVQDRTSTAEATNLGNKVSDTVTNLQNDLKSYGIDVAARHGATNALASSLVSAVNQAPAGSPEQAAAVAKVQAYKSKLESAKQKWNQTKGKDLFPVTVSFDDYLKALEKQGVFNV